ncbi:MAG: hypothetical protein Q8911_11935 [Bacillota bacterium]|nr:hypothetical protein [Bacillota bacterium]
MKKPQSAATFSHQTRLEKRSSPEQIPSNSLSKELLPLAKQLNYHPFSLTFRY